jgi:hypothetical protein
MSPSYLTNSVDEIWKERPSRWGVTRTEYRHILRVLSELVRNEMVDNPMGFKLPFRFGLMLVHGHRQNSTDLYNSKVYERAVYHRNVHSEGVTFCSVYLYGKDRGRFAGSSLFAFKSGYLLRRAITKRIREDRFEHWLQVEWKRDIKRLNIPAHKQKRFYK